MPLSDVIIRVLAVVASFGITGTIAAGAAYWLFKTFAKGWLDSRFQKDLEDFKAANAREVERLKAELSRYADRATKFHVREYEVLPEAWGLMNKAHGACQQAIFAFQQHADLDHMSGPHLEAWLDRSGLEEIQKTEIREAKSKNDKYGDFLSWKQIGDAEQAVANFQNYVVLQGVFIDEELAATMLDAGKAMRRALISRTMVERTKAFQSPNQPDFWTQAIETLEPVVETVRVVKENIRTRLSDIRPPET